MKLKPVITGREKNILIHTTEHDRQFHKNLQFRIGNKLQGIKCRTTTANKIFGFKSIGLVNYKSSKRGKWHFKHKNTFVVKI